jgi:hypothetical protein
MRKTYFVANDDGHIIGHDLDKWSADCLCAQMIQDDPAAGWEVMEDNNEDQ